MTPEQTKIQPAMTPEEWRDAGEGYPRYRDGNTWIDRRGSDVRIDWSGGWLQLGRADALAAIALHDQPFGFTWEIVDVLREIGQHNVDDGFYGCDPEAGRKILEHADRIAALLPPRKET